MRSREEIDRCRKRSGARVRAALVAANCRAVSACSACAPPRSRGHHRTNPLLSAVTRPRPRILDSVPRARPDPCRTDRPSGPAAHEHQAAPHRDELPAVLHLGFVAAHDRCLVVPDPPLVRRAVRRDLLDDGHLGVVHAVDRGPGRGPLGECGTPLRRASPARRPRAVLAAAGRRSDHDVLGHAAVHAVLHADDLARDRGRLFLAQERRQGCRHRLPADPRVGNDRLHRRAVDGEPAASRNVGHAVPRRGGRGARARPLRVHAAALSAAVQAQRERLAARRARPDLVLAVQGRADGGVSSSSRCCSAPHCS